MHSPFGGASNSLLSSPVGHGENGVLPTINSLLPLFHTLAARPRATEGRGKHEGSRRRDKNHI